MHDGAERNGETGPAPCLDGHGRATRRRWLRRRPEEWRVRVGRTRNVTEASVLPPWRRGTQRSKMRVVGRLAFGFLVGIVYWITRSPLQGTSRFWLLQVPPVFQPTSLVVVCLVCTFLHPRKRSHFSCQSTKATLILFFFFCRGACFGKKGKKKKKVVDRRGWLASG